MPNNFRIFQSIRIHSAKRQTHTTEYRINWTNWIEWLTRKTFALLHRDQRTCSFVWLLYHIHTHTHTDVTSTAICPLFKRISVNYNISGRCYKFRFCWNQLKPRYAEKISFAEWMKSMTEDAYVFCFYFWSYPLWVVRWKSVLIKTGWENNGGTYVTYYILGYYSTIAIRKIITHN